MRLSVIGTGYLGATHAASMAELGHKVVGVDIDPIKIDRLAAGHVPFYEPGLPELPASTSRRARCASRRRSRRQRPSPICTSYASEPRRSRVSTPPI